MIFIVFQFAIFFDEPIDNAERFGRNMNERCGEFFCETLFVLPQMNDAPIDMPVASYKDKSGKYTCNISRTRLDMFVGSDGEDYSFESLISSHKTVLSPHFAVIADLASLSRIGLVGQFFHVNDNPYGQLSKKYIRKAPFELLSDIGLKFAKRETIRKIGVNHIVDLRSANINTKASSAPRLGTHIQLDINSNATQGPVDFNTLNEVVNKCIDKFTVREIERFI